MLERLLFPHNMQKALHVSKALEKKTCKIKGRYLITIKEDGWYFYADFHPELGWSPCYSSSGRAIPAWEDLRREMQRDFRPLRPCRIIAEAIIPDTPFHILNGIFNRKYEVAKYVELKIHDIIDFSEGVKGFWEPAARRWDKCNQLELPPYIQLAHSLGWSENISEWEGLATQVIEDGGEGIVIKKLEAPYASGKRDESLMKLKSLVEADLLCTAIEPTIGKKGEPSLNAILRSKAGNTITVVVPKNSDRLRFENDTSLILGKVVSIRAMSLLDSGAYREPRFYCVREDKLPTDID